MKNAWWILLVYSLVGPGAWAIFWFAMVKGRARLNLRRKTVAITDTPLVSVIVPCRNEAGHIKACCQSLLAQDYPNFELLMINDRSTDDTGAILDQLASMDARLRVLHVRDGELPDGWFGKTYAMHVGAIASRGEWMVFTDSDCDLKPAAVREGVTIGVAREFDLVSFVPQFVTRGFADSLMTPIGGIVTSGMYTMMYANSAQLPNIAFACGQYMAVRKKAYEQIGGWESVRHLPSDDVEIARRMKQSGLRPRVGWGMDLVAAHMYDNWHSVYHGWSRNFIMASRGKPWRVLAALIFIVVCVMTLIPAALWGLTHLEVVWIAVACVHLLLITSAMVSAYRWGGFEARYGLLWPIGVVLLLAIFMRSLYLCIVGKMDWRGVSYSLRMK